MQSKPVTTQHSLASVLRAVERVRKTRFIRHEIAHFDRAVKTLTGAGKLTGADADLIAEVARKGADALFQRARAKESAN